ncbi:hypothetical protein NG799_27095 [Laspinema sp. D1]|uniref:Lipoprotein n=1 Tax=Laspinema palackyanum D2a TaxID=2953684 RepID=A0ABT2MZ00_9CYAN|nr:hypothetical protein [Laspinema sp. D2a]
MIYAMKKLFFLVPLLLLTISSCGTIPEPGPPVDTIVNTINSAIRRLESNSESWQKVLEETRDKLIKEGQSTIATEVSNVLTRATSAIGIEAKCYTDFLRDRTKEDLIRLRAKLTKENFELTPVFCNPTPSSIDMNLPPERRPIIEIAGYNLTKNSVRVFLVNEQGYKLDVSNTLDNPTHYLLTVNLSRVPLGKDSERFVFEFPSQEEQSIAIIKESAKPPKEEFSSSRIRITGTINMNDDEYVVSDQNKDITVDTYVDVSSGGNTAYRWEDCVGGEVQGYLDVQMQLDKQTGVLALQGTAKYYEGTRCGPTNLRKIHPFDLKVSPGKGEVFQAKLSDNEGGVTYNLKFTNAAPEKAIRAERVPLNRSE